MGSKHQVLIVGGGTAGITTAAHLLKRNRKLDVTIVDPAEWHSINHCGRWLAVERLPAKKQDVHKSPSFQTGLLGFSSRLFRLIQRTTLLQPARAKRLAMIF